MRWLVDDPQRFLEWEQTLWRRVEEGHSTGELLLWESRWYCVVLGHSSRPSHDVHIDKCAEDGVPVLRRGSGGGTVLLGPGCLNYAVALPFAADPRLRDVGASMAILLTRIGESLGVRLRGTSDLVWGDRKVSGNAQRRGHKALLLHGTILYDFDVETFGRYLREPERQPSYRAGRRHSQFVCNLPMAAEQIRVRIASCFPPACSR